MSHSVLYIYQGPFPWEVRSEKIVSSLASAGLSTTILAQNDGNSPRREQAGDYEIRRLGRGWGRVSSSLINFPAFFSPFWIKEIIAAVVGQQADLIVVRDLPLAPAAVLVSSILRVPVILDMAEDYPGMIEDIWLYGKPGRFDAILRNPRFLRWLERWVVRHVDGILVVSDASGARVAGLLDARPVTVTVVENTPRRERKVALVASDASRRVEQAVGLKLLYVGGLQENRGIDIAIKALKSMEDRLGLVELFVVGDGPGAGWYRNVVKEEAVADRVHFLGWQDSELVPEIIRSADICLVPHYVTRNTETTVPNKIYDYMYMAKPVLVSSCATLKSIVEANECGLWFTDKSSADFADKVVQMSDPDVRERLGRRGQEAVEKQYNWDVDAKRLLAAVSRTLEPARAPT